ncbi:MAG: superoxide dismutase [Ni], partial [Opitutae bacterium]
MNIKSYLCLVTFTCLSAISAHGHCQVPCGIFADQHRFEQMLEDQATIEKAGKLIAELSGKKDALSQNQLSRWVATKEAHAYNIQKVIAEYFLAQRI